jgi:hypothetical protein
MVPSNRGRGGGIERPGCWGIGEACQSHEEWLGMAAAHGAVAGKGSGAYLVRQLHRVRGGSDDDRCWRSSGCSVRFKTQ